MNLVILGVHDIAAATNLRMWCHYSTCNNHILHDVRARSFVHFQFWYYRFLFWKHYMLPKRLLFNHHIFLPYLHLVINH